MNKADRERYFSILANIEQPTETDTAESRVLIIDSTNTVIRSHCAAPVMSDTGEHVGGITGYFLSVNYAIRNINPTRVIHVFDGKGGSSRRRKLFPGYKAKRATSKNILNTSLYTTPEAEVQSLNNQMLTLVEYLKVLPVSMMCHDYVEADDVIAYITEYYMQKNETTKVHIMSTDKDFLQLVNDRVVVWSPTKKKFYDEARIQEEFGIPPQNLVFARAMDGDPSDEIPGVKGWGLKTIHKRLPFLSEKVTDLSTDTIFTYIADKIDDAKVYKVLQENKKQYELNYKLMQLSSVDISGTTKEAIRYQLEEPINRLAKHKFIQRLVADGLHTSIKSPETWIRDNYRKLDTFASMANNKQ